MKKMFYICIFTAMILDVINIGLKWFQISNIYLNFIIVTFIMLSTIFGAIYISKGE